MDDGIGGGFVTVAGGSLNSHQVKHAIIQSSAHTGTIVKTTEAEPVAPAFIYALKKGLSYRFRYRAQNLVGWSSYSPISYVLTATLADAPGLVTYVSSSATAIKVKLGQSA